MKKTLLTFALVAIFSIGQLMANNPEHKVVKKYSEKEIADNMEQFKEFSEISVMKIIETDGDKFLVIKGKTLSGEEFSVQYSSSECGECVAKPNDEGIRFGQYCLRCDNPNPGPCDPGECDD